MGLFRYITQGFGWSFGGVLGAQASREGIEALSKTDEPAAEPPRDTADDERARRAHALWAARHNRAARAKRQAEIEAQLDELKRRAKR